MTDGKTKGFPSSPRYTPYIRLTFLGDASFVELSLETDSDFLETDESEISGSQLLVDVAVEPS